MGKTTFTAEPGKQEVVMTRLLDAPRERVFAIYTDPSLMPEWWGPRNLTSKVEKMDVRPGGSWRVVQRDIDGNEYAFHGVYHQVKPPELLVFTFEYEGVPDHVLLSTVRFDDVGGKTLVTDQSVYQSAADRDGDLKAGMQAGAEETVDRLAELVEKEMVAQR